MDCRGIYGECGEGKEGLERELFARVYYVRRTVVNPLNMRRVAVWEVIACESADIIGVEIIQPTNVDLFALQLERWVLIVDLGYERLCTSGDWKFWLFSFLEGGQVVRR